MAFALPKSRSRPERENAAPQGVQLAGPPQAGGQDVRSLHAMLDLPLSTLIEQNKPKMSMMERAAVSMMPASMGKQTLREALKGPMGSQIRPQIEARLKDMGLTPQHLEKALTEKPPAAEEKTAQAAPKPAAQAAPAAAAAPTVAAAAPTQAAPAPSPAPAPAQVPPVVAGTGAAVPAAAPAAAPQASPAAGGGGAVPDRMAAYKRSIAGIESGGNYGSLGTVITRKDGTRDQALGKYQIMQSNLPQWSKDALGQPITREQFLKSPELQDKIFEHRFGQYVKQHGEEGAARAWYAGEKGMKNLGASDVHGRLTVANYGRDFVRGLGSDGAQGSTTLQNTGGPSTSGDPEALTPSWQVGRNTPDELTPAFGPYTVPEPPSSGGGIGSDAIASNETPTPAAGGFDFGKAAGGFGEALDKLGTSMGGSASAQNNRSSGPANLPMASLPPPAPLAPITDPRMADMQRQQLALAMQRLNSGRLF